MRVVGVDWSGGPAGLEAEERLGMAGRVAMSGVVEWRMVGSCSVTSLRGLGIASRSLHSVKSENEMFDKYARWYEQCKLCTKSRVKIVSQHDMQSLISECA